MECTARAIAIPVLKQKIAVIRTQFAPEGDDLTRARADIQFKLHGVHRKSNCYTHLRHIANESYKHLDSWSQNNINMQTNDRNLLLHKYYKFVQQYTTQQVKILDFLTRRVRWETSQLESKEQEAAKYRDYYGANGERESQRTIERHRMRMQEDQHALTFLEAE